MFDVFYGNREWLFSGIGVSAVAFLFLVGKKVYDAYWPRGLKVKVEVALFQNGLAGLDAALAISVQNRTASAIFIKNVFLESMTGQKLTPLADYLTGEGQTQREVLPGASFEFRISRATLREFGIIPENTRCAGVVDAVERIYRSPRWEIQRALNYLRLK